MKAGAKEDKNKEAEKVDSEVQCRKRRRDEDILGIQTEPMITEAKNGYVLRKRKRSRKEDDLGANENTSIAQTTSKPKTKPKRKAQLQLQERILNEVPSKEYLPNEIILATVPGYAPWPARIIEMIGQTILVEFFGTGQRNLVRPNSVRHFDIKVVLPLLNRKGYKKAMTELESCLGIPPSLSVLS